jgi:hypothetical protein
LPAPKRRWTTDLFTAGQDGLLATIGAPGINRAAVPGLQISRITTMRRAAAKAPQASICAGLQIHVTSVSSGVGCKTSVLRG